MLKRDLAYAGANLGEALSSLIDAQGTVTLAYRQGEWYSASVSLGESSGTSRPASLPASLVKMVSQGVPARQRVIAQGQPAVVVGVPLESVHADYFEIQSLGDLDRTLSLLAVGVVRLFGGYHCGRFAGRAVGERAAGAAACTASPTWPPPYPEERWTSAFPPRMTPTSRCWPPRSTRWWPPSKSGSRETPGLPRT